MPKPLKIAVLALQGAFEKHIQMVKSLGAEAEEVRQAKELDRFDALIIPGGESTTISKQISFVKTLEMIQEFAKTRPIFGTCAGLILMSKQVLSPVQVVSLDLLDVTVERNAYGRQTESFSATIPLSKKIFKTDAFPALFIRAPRILHCSRDVNVLATFENEPIFIQQGLHLGCTFHPELSEDRSIHRYFLSLANR